MGSNEFIRVKVEGISQLEKMRAFLDPKLFQKATRSGILAAAKSANKQAGKSISQRYNIGSRRIKQDVSLFTGLASRGEATLTFAAPALVPLPTTTCAWLLDKTVHDNAGVELTVTEQACP